MKKTYLLMLGLVLVMLLAGGCSSAESVEPAPTLAIPASPTPGVKPTTYKDTMLPFDQLPPGNRIVILQNTINYGREGFYTPETRPVTQEISYKGASVAAYPMTYALAFLKNGSAGALKITSTSGAEQEMTAEEFTGLFIIIDFTSDAPPVLYNPDTGAELTDFLFAVTAEGEAIYSVVSSSIHNAAELIASVGWDANATYRYMATDKFYFPVGPAEAATGEVRGTLSGAVNGSFPDLKIASGKINDLVYIEVIEE